MSLFTLQFSYRDFLRQQPILMTSKTNSWMYKESTVKPVLSSHSKIDKTEVLKTNGSLMKVKSIAECSLGAFCNIFDRHQAIIGLENHFLVFFLSGCLRQALLYKITFLLNDTHLQHYHSYNHRPHSMSWTTTKEFKQHLSLKHTMSILFKAIQLSAKDLIKYFS